MGDIINSPIESRHPVDVAFGAKELDPRQQQLLDKLPGYGSEVVVKKRDVSMLDLSAMTAATGGEFALFTKGKERLVVRGSKNRVPISPERALEMQKQGYHWSGHTHPQTSIVPSSGDRLVLKAFGQN